MKRIIPALTLVILVGCGTPKQVVQNSLDAQELALKQNHAEALIKAETVIAYFESKQKSAPDTIYALAGKMAIKTNNPAKAAQYLEKSVSLGNKSEATWLNLASAYEGIHNLSKEISALEWVTDSFPESANLASSQKRLMHTYTITENWEKAKKLWPEIGNHKARNAELMEDYVFLQQATGTPETIFKSSANLLALDGENKTALYNIARHYYTLAENRYNREMEAYEMKKTRRQYGYLLDQLKLATKDFKTSRTYFEQLYKLNPKSEYAGYLANINLRLNNQKQAEFYKNKANQ